MSSLHQRTVLALVPWPEPDPGFSDLASVFSSRTHCTANNGNIFQILLASMHYLSEFFSRSRFVEMLSEVEQ